MAQNNALIIGVALIVVVLVLAPIGIGALLQGARGFFEDFRNAWFSDWGTGDGNENTTSVNGGASIGLTIYYKDGTSRDFKADEFSIIPLTISDAGGEISQIGIELWTRLVYEGDIQSWSAQIILDYDIMQGYRKIVDFVNVDTTVTPNNIPDDSGLTPPSGEKPREMSVWGGTGVWRLLDHRVYSASAIKSKISSEGSYYLQMRANVKMDVTFADGTTDQRLGFNEVSWTFLYTTDSELMSMDVAIVYTPFHP